MRRLLRHLSLRPILIQRRWRPRRLLRMRNSHSRLIIRLWWSWRLLRLYALIALSIVAGVYRGLCISELLASTLQRRMLSLLPSRNIWRRWNIYAGHGICIRWHVCLHALSRQRRRDVCRLLFVRAHDRRGLRRGMLRRVRERARLICTIYRARSPSLCWRKV